MAKTTRPSTQKKSTTRNIRPAKTRPGLGKGLGALIGDPRLPSDAPPGPASSATVPAAPDLPDPPASRTVRMIPVGDIRRSPWQPRQAFEDASLNELTASIRTHGVLQPLLCRRTAEGIELVAGERRLRAAIAAGLDQVPVVFREVTDAESAEIALIENLQREDLNPIEEAEGYRQLGERFNLTQQEIADRVGKARASITNAMRLLDLPEEVRLLVGDGRLSAGHAKVLLGLRQETDCILLARRCVTDGLSVRSIEQQVRKHNAERAPARPARLDIPPSHTAALTDRLRHHFGTAVRLLPSSTRANGRRVKGSLEIDFYDNDDLDRILALLGITLDGPV